MAAPMRVQRCIGFCRKFINISSISRRYFSNELPEDGKTLSEQAEPTRSQETTSETVENDAKPASFAEAFAKHAALELDEVNKDTKPPKQDQEPQDFATMLRNSSHVHLGAAKSQMVIGKIFHVVEDDLYIDFGGKFHCVCKRPEENKLMYHRGAQVRLRLKDLEVSDHFIGASKEFSILEADAFLLGVMDSKTGQFTTARTSAM